MKKLKKYSGIAFTLVFLLSVSLAITQIHKGNGLEKKIETITKDKADSPVEDIELPLNEDPWKELQNIVSVYYQSQGVSYSGSLKVIDGNTEEEKVIEEEKF